MKKTTMVTRGNSTRKSSTVLVINHDPEINHILEVNLVHASLKVLSATNGLQALELIQKNELDIIILDTALPDLTYSEMCQRINEISSAAGTPMIVIGYRRRSSIKLPETGDNVIHIVTKPFEPKEVVALVQGYLLHKERMQNKDPLTGLPNRAQLSREITGLIAQKATLAVIYITMHNLNAINKAYGYSQGDHIIRLLADVVSEAVRLFGNPNDLAGHLGGDKFIITSSPWKARTLCRRIIADYNRRIKYLYSDIHLQTGYAAFTNPPASKEQTPNMSIHIAVVTNQNRIFNYPNDIIQAASEQIEILKHIPESNCYFDIKEDKYDRLLALSHKAPEKGDKEGARAAQEILAWFDFLVRELDSPVNEVKGCLKSLESFNIRNLKEKQLKSIESLQKNCRYLIHIAEGIASLAKLGDSRPDIYYQEVDLQDILALAVKHMKAMLEQKQVQIQLETTGNVERIIRNKRSLLQCMIYIIRSKIRNSPAGSDINIHLAEKNEEYISIKICSSKPNGTNGSQNGRVQKQPYVIPEIKMNELDVARLLLRSIGGELEVTDQKQKGITYSITMPKKWHTWIQEIDTLRIAMEISRKEARETLNTVQKEVTATVKKIPAETKDNLNRLSNKVQELAVICNRSLYLADDYSNKLELQQDLLLKQESEQYAASEAVLTICREMTKSADVKNLFDIESAKRVISYSLAIAKELKLPDADRQALYYASLYKDITLAFSRNGINIPGSQSTTEVTTVMRERLNTVWKSLTTVPFFAPACNFILYRWENYDGTGGSFGIKGTGIPVGSRILAVADTYDRLTSGDSVKEKLSPETAMQIIADNAGFYYDPRIVDAFLALWKRREIDPAFGINNGQLERNNILT
jgi:diguanylate cyclase (GGDEF)-like protein